MAISFSNISTYSPFLHGKFTGPSPSLKTRIAYYNCIKASAEGRTNLDNLQRASQPRKKTASVAPIGLLDRFPAARTVQQMMDTMERMIDDPLAYSSTWPSAQVPARERNGYSRGRTPWEIKERESDYAMRFDVPGMTKNDVKLSVEQNMLVVKAEKVPPMKGGDSSGEDNGEDNEEWPAKSFGKYSSRIALPEDVELEKIVAKVRDGVLYITIPKARITANVMDINVQ